MRIAEINMMHTGSTGKIMFGISDCARKAGHEVNSYSPINFMRHSKMTTPPIAHHSYFGTRSENCLHTVLGEITGFQNCWSYFGTKQLIKELDKFNPHIIHLHNLHNRCINIPVLFRYIKIKKIPVVWTLHDCWAFTGQCPHFTMIKCEKWKTGCNDCSQIHEYPKSFVDRTKQMWLLKRKWFTGVNNMTLVTPSLWLSNLVKQSYLKEYPIKVINNGIDLSVFKPTESYFKEKYNLNNKYILLGVAFDWDVKKGLDVFINLSQRLGPKYKMVLVGTNNNIDKLLPENIISIHKTNDQKELASIYTAADLFVNPTRQDNYPTVNMESIACGTPVITFDTGGSAEMLNAKCGCVVPYGDVKTMESSIVNICQNKLFSNEDCLLCAKSYDQNKRFQDYIDLYESI